MKKEYKIENSIRGDFHRISLTKRYKGMPGFAPDYHDIVIGDIVVMFRDEEPYFQTSSDTFKVLQLEDIIEIKDLLERGYMQEDFKRS